MMDVNMYFIICSRFFLWLRFGGHNAYLNDGCKDAFCYLFYLFFFFFAMVKIWWPQGVIWMFNLYVFCGLLEIFCCDEQLGGH
jgi:hypothetical protein